MKAIKVEVPEHEWDKVGPFVEYINDDDVVAYQTVVRNLLWWHKANARWHVWMP